MKKEKSSFVVVCLLCGSILFTSCIGSFALTNRLKDWNQGIGNKFVNELVFIALNIVPVYGVSLMADLFVINSIEFWTEDNPIANVGEVKAVKGENSDFLVETLENGYSITNTESEESFKLIFNKEANTWSIISEHISTDLIKMNEDGTADLYLPDGEPMNVTLDAQGILAARQISLGTYYALK